MGLARISIRNFRCIASTDLELDPSLNLIIGKNASGKTSLIEAVYLLGRGRSFRAGNLDSIVRAGSAEFQIHGLITHHQSAIPIPVRLVQSHRQLSAKIAGAIPENLAKLSENFPVQLIDSQAHQLIGGGPRNRRQYLDWGVFHVEPTFFPTWRKYQRALQQRNALLRGRRALKELAGWDEELVVHGTALDRMRRTYLVSLIPTAQQWASQAVGGAEVILDYQPGWPAELSLAKAMEKSNQRDYETGHTRCGPHRADISISIDGDAAREKVSMGQEKVLAGSLLLAQAAVYRVLTDRVCTLLLDDLPSELDSLHQQRFLQRVLETGSQTLITAIDSGQGFMDVTAKMFHVEQGKIT